MKNKLSLEEKPTISPFKQKILQWQEFYFNCGYFKKFLIIAICVIGFMYQFGELCAEFSDYPAIVSVEIEYPKIRQLPAITFCNNNAIKRTEYCKRADVNCTIPPNLDIFLDDFPHYRNGNKQDFKLPSVDDMNKKHDTEMVKEYGPTIRDMMRRCKIYNGTDSSSKASVVDCDLDSTLNMQLMGETEDLNCFIMFSHLNRSAEEEYKLRIDNVHGEFMSVVFNFDAAEYFRPLQKVSGSIMVHSPYDFSQPLYNSFLIRPGIEYIFHIKTREQNLLESPYKSDCTNYTALWKSRGGNGPLTMQGCYNECLFNVSLRECKCASTISMHITNEKKCTFETDKNNVSCEFYEPAYYECRYACKQACHLFDVESTVTENYKLFKITPEEIYNGSIEYPRHYSLLRFLLDPEMMIINHKPQYNLFEVLGLLDGYIGFWLGVSFTAAFGIIESTVIIIKLWITKHVLHAEGKNISTYDTKL